MSLKSNKNISSSEFENEAQNVGSQNNVVNEFWDFLMQNKKWWLAPIVIVMLLLGLLLFLTNTGALPFVYSLY